MPFKGRRRESTLLVVFVVFKKLQGLYHQFGFLDAAILVDGADGGLNRVGTRAG